MTNDATITVGWIIVQSPSMRFFPVRFQYNFISTCMLFSAEIRSISDDCHVSTNIGVSHHTSGRYNGISFKVWRPNHYHTTSARALLSDGKSPNRQGNLSAHHETADAPAGSTYKTSVNHFVNRSAARRRAAATQFIHEFLIHY